MLLQAKEHGGPLEPGGGKEGPSLEFSKRPWPYITLISDFWLPNCERKISVFLSSLVCGKLSWQPKEAKTKIWEWIKHTHFPPSDGYIHVCSSAIICFTQYQAKSQRASTVPDSWAHLWCGACKYKKKLEKKCLYGWKTLKMPMRRHNWFCENHCSCNNDII